MRRRRRRVFWLLLISSILFIFFNNFHFHSTSSTPTTSIKESEAISSLKKLSSMEEPDSYADSSGEDSFAEIESGINQPEEGFPQEIPLHAGISSENSTVETNPPDNLSADVEGMSDTVIYVRESRISDPVTPPPVTTNPELVIITGIEYWLAPDQTQVVINLDRSLTSKSYRTFNLSNPPRFVVEFAQGKYLQGKQIIQVHDKVVKTIRLQRLTSGRFQVVFDLVQPQIEAKVLQVDRVNDQPDRILVNITHPREKEVNFKKKQQVVQNLKQKNYKIVVIDPGHGGSDSGAVGQSGAMEKNIVLNISRKLKSLLDQTGNIKAYLTRDGDYFLSLARRTQIAREYEADLFISIHVNANHDNNMSGFSVYCLSQKATDEAAKLLAQRENASDHIGGVIFDQEDPALNEILFDLSQSSSLNRSLEFGVLILDKIPSLKVRNEGLKRANFAVLRAPDVPSVLVEALYISNPYEEQLLVTPSMQNRIAMALYQSMINYFERFYPPYQTKNERIASVKNTTASRKVLQEDLVPVHQTIPENNSFNRPLLPNKLVPSQPLSSGNGISVQDEFQIHIVKEGETLWRIANLYKVDMNLLIEINRLKGSTIYTGQRLKIP